MEDMRAIFMYKDTVLVVMIVGIAAYVWAPIHEQHSLLAQARQPLSENASRETSANDEVIEHYSLISRCYITSLRTLVVDRHLVGAHLFGQLIHSFPRELPGHLTQ